MKELKPLEHQNQRVLTTQQLAEIYETSVDNIKMNYKNHKDRFIEGKHYYMLKGDELKGFKNRVNDIYLVGKNANQLILWTEKGADRHCKILDTDKAWEQFDNLEDTYFRVKENLAMPQSLPEALRAFADQLEQNEKLKLECNMQSQQIGELKPKADYVDSILKSKSLVTITQIAKDYGMSGTEMNRRLHELGIQYKQGSQWLLYKQYHDCGYTHSETIRISRSDGRPNVNMFTKWTQKGRLFLYELLKGEGVIPIIERGDSCA